MVRQSRSQVIAGSNPVSPTGRKSLQRNGFCRLPKVGKRGSQPSFAHNVAQKNGTIGVMDMDYDFKPWSPPAGKCDLWEGPTKTVGYGYLWLGSRTNDTHTQVYVHRLVWMQDNGPIPKELVVRHLCDNRLCINLDHLLLGTQGDNIRDMHMTGTAYKPEPKQACPSGHPYTPENSYQRRDGYVNCVQCNREGQARYQARKKLVSKT